MYGGFFLKKGQSNYAVCVVIWENTAIDLISSSFPKFNVFKGIIHLVSSQNLPKN